MKKLIEVECPECNEEVECEVELSQFDTSTWAWCSNCGGDFCVYVDDGGEVWTEDF